MTPPAAHAVPAVPVPASAPTYASALTAVLPPDPQRGMTEVRLEYQDAAGRTRTERDLHLTARNERPESDAYVLELRYADPETGVTLTRGYRTTPGLTVERTGTLRNGGAQTVTLRRFDALYLDMETPVGGWIAQTTTPDYGYGHAALAPGRPLTIAAPKAGAPLDQIPALVLAPSHGGSAGIFAGVGWSAGFELEASAQDATHSRLRVGEPVVGLTLQPGETLEAPPVFLGAYQGTLDDGARALRDAAQSLRPAPRLTAPPVTWNSWFAYDRHVDEVTLRAEAREAAALGGEVFYVDHGWQRLNGDWRAHPGRFTEGSLKSLSDYVHSLGMKFGVWMAFGVADPRAPVAAEHPEWIAAPLAQGVTPPIDGARLLCLSAAREWVLAEADRVVREYGVDWLKIDQAMIGDCALSGASDGAHDASLRANAQALYDVLDELRARHPALVIENCFNGGGYLDYGMYERTDVAWLTDSAGWAGARPHALQSAFTGATRALPPSYLTLWLTEAHVRDAQPLEYWGLSTMGGAWGLSLRLTDLSAADRSDVARLIESYKHLRGYVAGGRLEYVREPAEQGWFALEYARPDGAALLAVRNGGSGDEALSLSDLDVNATYRISCEGLSCSALSLPATASGARLMDGGLTLNLAPQQGAVLYFEKA